MIRACVLREVAGVNNYIPVEDAVLVPGESVFCGCFREEKTKDGPSGSHERTICLANGHVRSIPLSCCHTGTVAPSTDWKSVSGGMRYQNSERIFVSRRQYIDLLS